MKMGAMKLIDLSIVIVNWNSKDYVKNCIESIIVDIVDLDYEIIVVDSASFDGCGEMLHDIYPWVRFIQSERNVGFGQANNLGVIHSCGAVLLFLNPDTYVKGHAIEHLYSNLVKLPHAGIVGCRLLNHDHSLQTSCVMPFPTILNQVLDTEILQRWFPKISIWMNAAKYEGMISPVPVEAISGACMMIRKEGFKLVEGFSAEYFMYAEDLDLCYKIISAGFINYYLPMIEVLHYGGGCTQHSRSSFANVMMRQSISLMLKKTHSNLYSLCYKIMLSSSAVVRLFLLTLWLPIRAVRQNRRNWKAGFVKWISILRWGLGLENWVKQFDQSEHISPDHISKNT